MSLAAETISHDEEYTDPPWFAGLPLGQFADEYARRLRPYSRGGPTKGFVRGLSVRRLLDAAASLTRPAVVIDAGCGTGELALYLAVLGHQVHGIDLSPVGCARAAREAERLKVADRSVFHAASLAEVPLEDDSVDFVIGHAALHHFIKYDGIPQELARVLRPHGRGFFADAWGENPTYALFHDREQMRRLGDVRLKQHMVHGYFAPWFSVAITPADWFTMFDKLFARMGATSMRAAKLTFALDRAVPKQSRATLFLAGSALTEIRPVLETQVGVRRRG